MAGWLKRVDGSGLRSLNNLKEKKPISDLEPVSTLCPQTEESQEDDIDKLKCLFNEVLSVFLKQTSGTLCFLAFPPMLGNGQSVDLLNLYLTVREKGGGDKVSKNGLWGFVAEECGFDASTGSALKLIYAKYLNALHVSLQRLTENKGSEGNLNYISSDIVRGCLMDLEMKFKRFLSEAPVELRKDGKHVRLGSKMSGLDMECEAKYCDIDKQSDDLMLNGEKDNDGNANGVGKFVLHNGGIQNVAKAVLASSDDKDLRMLNGKMKGGDRKRDGKDVLLHRVGIQSVVEEGRVSDDVKVSTTNATDVDEVSDSPAGKEGICSIKRKRECASGILNWIKMVAEDPCDPVIGSLPESSKWNSYTSSHLWKQILLAREAMMMRKNVDSKDHQLNWQKKQRMHPTMYDDPNGAERLRYSQRVITAKECSKKNILESSSSSTQIYENHENSVLHSTANTDCIVNVPRQAKVLTGRHFQAEVNDWSGDPYDGDSKWLGVRVWPPEKVGKGNSLIEREPMGRGRSTSCGCPIPDSIECVKFHVFEKKSRLRLELGPVYYQWKIDSMGEDTVFSWTKLEENIFYDTVKSNPFYLGCFWDEIGKALPNKCRRSLVAFYFNVFLLRRRAEQNRSTPEDINSDDDEPDDGSEAVIQPGSIFCSPKKSKIKS